MFTPIFFTTLLSAQKGGIMNDIVMSFDISEVESIDAPSDARDFIEGVVVGLAIVSFFCGGC